MLFLLIFISIIKLSTGTTIWISNSSSNCPSGYQYISTKADCSTAAASLENGTFQILISLASSSQGSYPPGCSRYVSQTTGYNKYVWNRNTDSNIDCGHSHPTHQQISCLCEKIPLWPVCSNTDGTSVNTFTDDNCMCGTAECSTGEYCYAPLNKCLPVCANTDGTLQNTFSSDCVCGTADCSSGKYCYVNENMCRDVPANPTFGEIQEIYNQNNNCDSSSIIQVCHTNTVWDPSIKKCKPK